MAEFIAAAAGACSPACAAALSSASTLSMPFMTAIGLATAVGYAISNSKDKNFVTKRSTEKIHTDETVKLHKDDAGTKLKSEHATGGLANDFL